MKAMPQSLRLKTPTMENKKAMTMKAMPQSLRLKTPKMESAEAIALKENVMNAFADLPEMR